MYSTVKKISNIVRYITKVYSVSLLTAENS
nr:MAG TPA: hypothetical protein [Caudoviricetes sp.]